ncbi:MAG: hypothetical protein SFY68_15070, partial [Candidatus Sumerlaeia bacterium]|nr:hypothetical protein [Candidatus Sumerlaeia bacterium]
MFEKGSPTRKVLPLIGLLLWSLTVPCPADVVVMKNGSRIEGRVVEENQLRIVFDANGIRREINKSDISEIIRENSRAGSPAFEKLTEAENALNANNPPA